MPDINETCKTAWDSTKKEHQPAYDTLEQSYKEMLINRAGAIKGGVEMEDGPFAAFDAKALALSGAPIESALPPETEAELAQEAVDETGVVEIPPEVKEHLDLKGQLPRDFPVRDKLHDASINTYGQLAKVEDLTTIDGIGPATAKSIVKRLRADTKTLNK